MIINLRIHPNLYNDSTSEFKIVTVDPDPNDEIENIKILMSFKLPEIDYSNCGLFYQKRQLNTQNKVRTLALSENDFIEVRRVSSNCCELI